MMLCFFDKLRLFVAAAAAVGLAGCASLPRPASDLDQDGIGDIADRCPGQQEDGLAPDPNDGCAGSGAAAAQEVKP